MTVAPLAAPTKKNLLGLSRHELAQTLAPWIDRPYRVEQIYRAIHLRGVADLDQITELAKPLRERLSESFCVNLPGVESRRLSTDRTRKYLLRLEDGATIETVAIPDGERWTLCLSSQAGCALACTFCVTGYWGAGRNLDSGEIVGQVLRVRTEQPELHPSLNLVFMGMGEPLLNLDALKAALEILTETVPWRRITVSTAGIPPAIGAMAHWQRRPNLAVSLHAPDDERRTKLMPINRRYPLRALLDALQSYPLDRKQKITFEYILIRDFNDQPSDAVALARLLRRHRAKVNLIPLNPDPVLGSEMRPPSGAAVATFRRELLNHGVACTIRRPRGRDISAACGQLRATDQRRPGEL